MRNMLIILPLADLSAFMGCILFNNFNWLFFSFRQMIVEF